MIPALGDPGVASAAPAVGGPSSPHRWHWSLLAVATERVQHTSLGVMRQPLQLVMLHCRAWTPLGVSLRGHMHAVAFVCAIAMDLVCLARDASWRSCPLIPMASSHFAVAVTCEPPACAVMVRCASQVPGVVCSSLAIDVTVALDRSPCPECSRMRLLRAQRIGASAAACTASVAMLEHVLLCCAHAAHRACRRPTSFRTLPWWCVCLAMHSSPSHAHTFVLVAGRV